MKIFNNILPSSIPLEIAHDALIALSSGTLGEAGIVLIAGTGSIVYARLPDGTTQRVGGTWRRLGLLHMQVHKIPATS